MTISNRIRFLVLKRDGFRCVYCGARAGDVELQVDHVEPKAKGGANELENYVSACRDCNGGKGATEPISGAGISERRRPETLSRPGLVDKWFMILDAAGAPDRFGVIRAKINDTVYLVAFMSWFTGEITEMSLIDVAKMVTSGEKGREANAWRFFEDEAHFNSYGRNVAGKNADF